MPLFFRAAYDFFFFLNTRDSSLSDSRAESGRGGVGGGGGLTKSNKIFKGTFSYDQLLYFPKNYLLLEGLLWGRKRAM